VRSVRFSRAFIGLLVAIGGAIYVMWNFTWGIGISLVGFWLILSDRPERRRASQEPGAGGGGGQGDQPPDREAEEAPGERFRELQRKRRRRGKGG